MFRQTVTICNKLGMHARAAAKFVQLAARFDSEIKIQRSGREVNGKSIMGVMMLAAGKGVSIDISATGSDEQQAVEELSKLVLDRFGEAE
jgi:phosphocarrier protein HPr